jgi:hypothetical protein
MYIAQYVGDFLLSQWIWCVTFDLSHFIFGFWFMFILLAVSTKERLMRLSIISLTSYMFAFGFLFFLGAGLLSWLCDWSCDNCLFNPLVVTQWDVIQTNLVTGLVLTVFQALFFWGLSFVVSLPIRTYILVALASNMIAAWFAYVHILITMRHLF